jgi:hypothetical protein
LAFRSRFRDLLLPIPREWVHDAWIALLISVVAGCVPVSEQLIRYRQHGSQQLGERKRGLYGQYHAARRISRDACEAVAMRYKQVEERLDGLPEVPPERLALLRRKIEHHQRRGSMREPRTWRLPHIVREAWGGNYGRYSLGWKAVAQDLFLG